MKLRNKKTGEIAEFNNFYEFEESSGVQRVYCSLAELNEEWEDYEDDDLSKVIKLIDKGLEDEILPVSVNDFIEKLKAWKRLKDKGFRFIDHTDFDDGNITIWGKFNKELDEQDVNLLFGGEDDN